MSLLTKKPNKAEMFVIINGLFCGCLIIANTIATKVLSFGSIVLAGSIIIYPIVFIIGDVLTEIYGFNLAKKTIILGLFVNFIAVIAFQLIILLPGAHSEISNAFTVVFETSPRVLFGCFCSYFVGSYTNAYIMDFLKERYSKHLFLRCFLSTVFGELADSVIFLTISFLGVESLITLVTMIVCQVAFKILYEVIAYPLTKTLINWMKSLDDGPLVY